MKRSNLCPACFAELVLDGFYESTDPNDGSNIASLRYFWGLECGQCGNIYELLDGAKMQLLPRESEESQ